jgi:hypothetical protein
MALPASTSRSCTPPICPCADACAPRYPSCDDDDRDPHGMRRQCIYCQQIASKWPLPLPRALLLSHNP